MNENLLRKIDDLWYFSYITDRKKYNNKKASHRTRMRIQVKHWYEIIGKSNLW